MRRYEHAARNLDEIVRLIGDGGKRAMSEAMAVCSGVAPDHIPPSASDVEAFLSQPINRQTLSGFSGERVVKRRFRTGIFVCISRRSLSLPSTVHEACRRTLCSSSSNLSRYGTSRSPRLRFGRETAGGPGESGFVSTVRDGILRIPDVSETYDLSVGHSVILEGLEGYIHQLRIGEADTIALDFEGTVERAASFVWGALWSLRRLVGA